MNTSQTELRIDSPEFQISITNLCDLIRADPEFNQDSHTHCSGALLSELLGDDRHFDNLDKSLAQEMHDISMKKTGQGCFNRSLHDGQPHLIAQHFELVFL